jgi:predicted DsbA family dithiol-disulfide isomerase
MQVIHYTDPGCPFAFSAEPLRLRLEWTFGDQLSWTTVLIVLAESASEYEAKGITPAKLAAGGRMLQQRHGMPIDVSERPRLAATVPACRAVVAARLHDPAREDALLRALRVRAMGGGLLDDQALVDAAAEDAGLDAAQVAAWSAEDATDAELRDDVRRSRTPLPAALALDHKLAPSGDGGRRYTAPSLELHRGDRVVVAPGFQPWESYDVAIANLAPELERRAKPDGVEELLAWAPYPLATAEVAAIMESSIEDARTALDAVATFTPVGEDGYWSA